MRGRSEQSALAIPALRWLALATGIVLFATTLYFVDLGQALATTRRLGVALPLALAFSGLWHLARTWAWASSFPEPRTVGFARLLRVRLSAEAFSYLTVRGIAGEPLKIVLLADTVDAKQATAAVALERIAYLVGTLFIVGIGSVVAMILLPLTPSWFRVFRAFAIVAGIAAILSAAAITGRGTYLQSLLRSLDRRFGTSIATGRIGRFVAIVERLMLDLVRGNPRRLAVLATATVAAFACMVLEAWVILRAAGPSVALTGALAVETFSRVASFASAVIPANLGALEASSVAAAAAIGATGGAALAIARRIRGLFWAGLGLLIYPRQESTPDPSSSGGRGGTRRGTLLYLPFADDVEVPPWTRLAGLPIAERVIRAALKAGYDRVVVFSGPDVGPQSRRRKLSRLLRRLPGQISVVGDSRGWGQAVARLDNRDALTVVGPGTIVSPALLDEARTTDLDCDLASVPAGREWPESGVLRASAAAAADLDRVDRTLREWRQARLPLPTGEDVSAGRARLAIRLTSLQDLPAAEATIRRSSYKDTDARFARFNRRFSLPISIALIRTPLTANQFSIMLVALGLYSAWLFSLGHYWTGLLAAFLSLAASVLDGCDGEIARLKYQESALGCWIETVGDYSYYLAIFAGLTVGAVRQTGWELFYWLGGIALLGTLLSFGLLIFLRARITSGQPERLHAIARDRFKAEPTWWSRLLWRLAFTATRAAMPYGIFAFALVYALPAIVVLAAIGANVYWISLVVKLKDLIGEDEAVAA
jgi:phosphatidylglycerophosphate synthase